MNIRIPLLLYFLIATTLYLPHAQAMEEEIDVVETLAAEQRTLWDSMVKDSSEIIASLKSSLGISSSNEDDPLAAFHFFKSQLKESKLQHDIAWKMYRATVMLGNEAILATKINEGLVAPMRMLLVHEAASIEFVRLFLRILTCDQQHYPQTASLFFKTEAVRDTLRAA